MSKETIEQMWEKFAEHQPFADERGYGEAWRRMCDERTEDAAGEAADAAWDAAEAADAADAAGWADAAWAAAQAACTAEWVASWAATWAAVDPARAESGAKEAIECIEKAEGKQ